MKKIKILEIGSNLLIVGSVSLAFAPFCSATGWGWLSRD